MYIEIGSCKIFDKISRFTQKRQSQNRKTIAVFKLSIIFYRFYKILHFLKFTLLKI